MFWIFGPKSRGIISCLTRDRTRTPCIGRRSLNHWTAREVPKLELFLTNTAVSISGDLQLTVYWLETFEQDWNLISWCLTLWGGRGSFLYFFFLFSLIIAVLVRLQAPASGGVLPWIQITSLLYPFCLSTWLGRWNSVIPFTPCVNSNNLFTAWMSLPFSPHTFIVTGHNLKIILKTFHHQTAVLSLFFRFFGHISLYWAFCCLPMWMLGKDLKLAHAFLWLFYYYSK